jgi:hypothetical protein
MVGGLTSKRTNCSHYTDHKGSMIIRQTKESIQKSNDDKHNRIVGERHDDVDDKLQCGGEHYHCPSSDSEGKITTHMYSICWSHSVNSKYKEDIQCFLMNMEFISRVRQDF